MKHYSTMATGNEVLMPHLDWRPESKSAIAQGKGVQGNTGVMDVCVVVVFFIDYGGVNSSELT